MIKSRLIKGFVLVALLNSFLISGCKDNNTVRLRFIQHKYNNYEDEEKYAFSKKILCSNTVTVKKGEYYTKDEIQAMAEYVVPELNGDGYYSFTQFMEDYDSKTGYATIPFSDSIINENKTFHFAIIG